MPRPDQQGRPGCDQHLRALSAAEFHLLALLCVGLLSRHKKTAQVTPFEAAMGPQIGCAIGLPFLTLPLWYLATAAV